MVFLLLGQTAEEKASRLTAILYPERMANFLFAACNAFGVIHPAKINFFLCVLCALEVQIFNLDCGHSPP